MGEIKVISGRKSGVRKDSGLKQYLHKKVFSKEGQNIGRVKDVLFRGVEVEGIVVVKAMFFKKTFIDMEYVDKFTNDGILLKINPVTLIKGKLVFDKDGRKIGRVKKINRRTMSNAYDSFMVKKNVFSRQKMIYSADINFVKKNVVLKISVKK